MSFLQEFIQLALLEDQGRDVTVSSNRGLQKTDTKTQLGVLKNDEVNFPSQHEPLTAVALRSFFHKLEAEF